MISEWSRQGKAPDDRWLVIFRYMRDQQRPVENLSMLVQFGFSLPGASTDVERLFSMIFDIWSPDKPQMNSQTLEAVLNVKFNCNKSCQEFYDSIISDKDLLRQAQSQDKYTK